MIKRLTTPQNVIEIAFAGAPYVAESAITEADILTAQVRYITPILGEEMMVALSLNAYDDLLNDYVIPALVECVRIDANPANAPTTRRERLRAKALLRLLSDYVEENKGEFAEYSSFDNVMNRCCNNGGIVQVF